MHAYVAMHIMAVCSVTVPSIIEWTVVPDRHTLCDTLCVLPGEQKSLLICPYLGIIS